MRTHHLFPLLSGLLLAGLTTACGDDSSGDDATDDSTLDSGGGGDDSSETEPTETDETDTDTTPTDTEPTDTEPTDTEPTDTEPTDTVGEGDGGVDAGGGDVGDGDGGVDGGSGDVDGDGGVDGGDVDGDGGADGGDEDPLPEGACAETPEDPEDGAYGDCDRTLNGGTCALTCDDDSFVGGNATCTDGVWSAATCVPLGTLEARIGDAASPDNAPVGGAIVYVQGFFDPLTEECEASEYCQVSDEDGIVNFDAFPTGPQNVVIVADDFEEIALPIEIAPGDSQVVQLGALPTGFLNGNIVILLGWSSSTNLDLVLSVPADGGDAGASACIFGTQEGEFAGSLEQTPFARLERDGYGTGSAGRTETIRIALNDDGTGPYVNGTYSLVLNTLNVGVSLAGPSPAVRLIREGENGAAQVDLFTLPEDAVDGATGWHVFDLHGDGTLTAGGTTEAREEEDSPSELSECTNVAIDFNQQ